MALIETQLTALAEHLATRRSAILDGWRNAVAADPELRTAPSLPRSQFYDHIPELLDTFERKLPAWRRPDAATEEDAATACSAGSRATGNDEFALVGADSRPIAVGRDVQLAAAKAGRRVRGLGTHANIGVRVTTR